MYTQFEEYAVSALSRDSLHPPRSNGKLSFENDWTQSAFAIAIELSKQGFFEWEEFRQGMIQAIGKWESGHDLDDKSWSYYKCWVDVLEGLVLKSGLLSTTELAQQYQSVIDCKLSSTSNPLKIDDE